MKIIKTLCVSALLALSANAFAATITVGSMSRVDGSQTIEDSLNNRQWLGWDVTRGLNYAQTVAATQSGGIFAGYNIARRTDAQLFADALVGTGNCSYATTGYCQYSDNNDLREQLVGESYSNDSAYGYDNDYAWFLSESGNEVGITYVSTSYGSGQDSFYVGDWASINDADQYSNSGYYGPTYGTIGWLLYRDGNGGNVPEPSSLALLGLAVVGLARARRKS